MFWNLAGIFLERQEVVTILFPVFPLDGDQHHDSIKLAKVEIFCPLVRQRQRSQGFQSSPQFQTHQKLMKSIEIAGLASLAARAIELRDQ
jgi:hypothetical protein